MIVSFTHFICWSSYIPHAGTHALNTVLVVCQVAGYDGWVIHYQLDLSQQDSSSDPLTIWHTGGPGGSSIYGLYGEMGYWLIGDDGPTVRESLLQLVPPQLHSPMQLPMQPLPHPKLPLLAAHVHQARLAVPAPASPSNQPLPALLLLDFERLKCSLSAQVNQHSWNKISSMLYLEAPAGSFLSPVDMHSGFSYCMKDGVRQHTCAWDDVTQAEAYAQTLLAFYEAYPELQDNALYIAGERCTLRVNWSCNHYSCLPISILPNPATLLAIH